MLRFLPAILLAAFAVASCDDEPRQNVNVTGIGVIDCQANPDECAIDLNDNR